MERGGHWQPQRNGWLISPAIEYATDQPPHPKIRPVGYQGRLIGKDTELPGNEIEQTVGSTLQARTLCPQSCFLPSLLPHTHHGLYLSFPCPKESLPCLIPLGTLLPGRIQIAQAALWSS